MGNVNEFASATEFNIATYVIWALVISECIICFFTSIGNKGKKKKSDRGTVWLIIIGWIFSFTAGSFFRERDMNEYIRNMLLPHFAYYIGIVFILGGMLIRCKAIFTLKKSFTISVQTTKNQHLIKSGLYHIVRNPAYTGSIISLLGVALAYRHILACISVIIVCFICYGIRIAVEEKALKAQFKDEFNEYCRETKYRLIPGIY